jgi:hypothetical protein
VTHVPHDAPGGPAGCARSASGTFTPPCRSVTWCGPSATPLPGQERRWGLRVPGTLNWHSTDTQLPLNGHLTDTPSALAAARVHDTHLYRGAPPRRRLGGQGARGARGAPAHANRVCN